MPPHSDSTLVRPYFLERKTGFEPATLTLAKKRWRNPSTGFSPVPWPAEESIQFPPNPPDSPLV